MAYIHSTRKYFFLWFLFVVFIAFCSGYALVEHTHSQTADDGWSPAVISPEFPHGEGPEVLIDAAHGNFPTVNWRYSAFAELLELDSYRTQSADIEGVVTWYCGFTWLASDLFSNASVHKTSIQ